MALSLICIASVDSRVVVISLWAQSEIFVGHKGDMMKIVSDQLLDILYRTITEAVRSQTPDLSARQLAIILFITTDSSMHTVRGLAVQLNISKPAISRSLDRLCELGFADRTPDPRDGRSVLVIPTNDGYEHVAKLRAMLQNSLRALSGRRPPRRSQPVLIITMVAA
jgi:DNA-binding MarR family transcriptional regulator